MELWGIPNKLLGGYCSVFRSGYCPLRSERLSCPMVRGTYKRLPHPFTKLACVKETGRGSILLRPCNLGHVVRHILNRKAPLPANFPCCQFLTLDHAPHGADADPQFGRDLLYGEHLGGLGFSIGHVLGAILTPELSICASSYHPLLNLSTSGMICP